MTDKLKPCPFCGGEAELIKGWCELDNYVMCLSCRIRTKPMNTKESAIKKWNTRKPMDKIVELLKMCAVNEPLTENGVTVRTVKVMPLPIALEIVKGMQNE